MVLVGKVNKDIVLRLGRHGQPGVGLCGDDGMMLRAERMTGPEGEDLGYVGRIVSRGHRRPDPRRRGLHPGRSLGWRPTGTGVSMNVNADEAASAVAGPSALRRSSS